MLPAFHERRVGQPYLGRAEVNALLTDGDYHRCCDAELTLWDRDVGVEHNDDAVPLRVGHRDFLTTQDLRCVEPLFPLPGRDGGEVGHANHGPGMTLDNRQRVNGIEQAS
jgi:hypothetical protein